MQALKITIYGFCLVRICTNARYMHGEKIAVAANALIDIADTNNFSRHC